MRTTRLPARPPRRASRFRSPQAGQSRPAPAAATVRKTPTTAQDGAGTATAGHARGSWEHSRRSLRCGIALIRCRAPSGIAPMCRAAFRPYIHDDNGGHHAEGTIMRAAPMTALLLGAAALATGCSAGGSPDRAVVPSPRPVVLTMASALTDSEELGTFVHEVSALTGGTVRIDVRSHWRTGQIGYESGLIADVRAGKADLGVASSRAFDSAGVLSLRALDAPLLITSYAAEQAVLTSPVTTKLLSALHPAGLTGIGILPGDLFRPDGVAGPLVKPSDYAGQRIGTQQSSVAEATLRALGAKPEWVPAGGTISRFDGVSSRSRSIQGYQYDRAGKFLTDQRGPVAAPARVVLHRQGTGKAHRRPAPGAAAGRHRGASRFDAGVRGDEQEIAQDLCRGAAAHRRNRRPMPTSPPCAPRSHRSTTSWSRTPRPAAPSAPSAPSPTASRRRPRRRAPSQRPRSRLSPCWTACTRWTRSSATTPPTPTRCRRTTGTGSSSSAARISPITQQYQNACTWGYGKLAVTGAQMEWTFTDGGGIAPNNAQNKPGEYFVFGWSLYRGTLTLTPVPGQISPVNFRMKPWHRISTTPSFSYLNKSCPPPADALG